jgi:hypothetical protein
VSDAADVMKLAEDDASTLMYSVRDLFPTLDMLLRVDTRHKCPFDVLWTDKSSF